MDAPSTTPPPPNPTAAAYFEHQVAGHNDIQLLSDGKLAKPATKTELAFYIEAQNEKHEKLRAFLPQFYGTTFLASASNPDEGHVQHILIENILIDMNRPCLLDVKLGTILYDAEASEEKRKKMERQAGTTTSGSTGVRICGMKIWDPQTDTYLCPSRDSFRQLAPTELPAALKAFFSDPTTGESTHLHHIPRILSLLQQLRLAFTGDKASLIASSVLIAYDALALSSTTNEPRVKIIDFAHSRFLEAGDEVDEDEGYVFGLDNLTRLLEEIYRGGADYVRKGRSIGPETWRRLNV